MHPELENLSLMTWGDILGTEESARDFLLHPQVNLIPNRDQPPDCPRCGSQMKAVSNNEKKFGVGFIFVCSQKYKSKCNGKVNPTQNTFMEGAKIGCQDMLAITFAFVLQLGITFILRQINQWRKKRGMKSMSSETIVDYFSYLREIAEVVSSHNSKKLGGFGKSIEIDETFLSTRKYHRGRKTTPMTITVLGIYCREDKDGVFFIVNGKKKKDLWPLIKQQTDPETTFIYTDSAKSYVNVDELFDDGIHMTVNHKKGEFVDSVCGDNHINTIENQNKLLKKTIKSHQSVSGIRQYMALYFYMRTRLPQSLSDGERINGFLQDIKQVYPGYNKEPLTMKILDEPTPESMGISHLMPKEKRPRPQSPPPTEDDGDLTYIDNIDDDPNWELFQ